MADSRNSADDRSQAHKKELFQKRTLIFAAQVIHTLAKHKTAIPFSIANQLTRSATSIGANYAEACNASSKLDFRNKIYIAKKEAAETRYWIDLCIELSNAVAWQKEKQEIRELLLILQAIVNTLRRKSPD